MRTLAVTLAAVLAATSPPVGAPQSPEPPTIPVLAAEVAVDFVVRDKKGLIVRDLKPTEVETPFPS